MKEYEQDLQKLIQLSNGGCDPVYQGTAEMTEAQLRFLAAKGLISLIAAGDDEFYAAIEPAGLAYFSNQAEKSEQEQEKLARQEKMFEQLKKMADAAQEQANAAKDQARAAKDQARLAKENAESAAKESHEAKRQSKISNLIALIAIVVAILAWLIPREVVYQAIRTFFQSH